MESTRLRRAAGLIGLVGASLFFVGDMLFYGHLGPGDRSASCRADPGKDRRSSSELPRNSTGLRGGHRFHLHNILYIRANPFDCRVVGELSIAG